MRLIFQSLQRRRIKAIGSIAIPLLLGVGSFLKVYKESLHLYLSPSEVQSQAPSKAIRMGGILQRGSLDRRSEGIAFNLEDPSGLFVPVVFTGTPPRLLKEGQETIVMGYYRNDVFEATEVLAKHDEYYRDPQDIK